MAQVEFKNNGTTRLTTTNSYDRLNRLTSIINRPANSPAISFAYDYNEANQRTRAEQQDGSH